MAHIGEHGLSVDVEHALADPLSLEEESDSTGRPLIFGEACDGRVIAVVYEWIDELTLLPITAYRVED